MTNCLKVCITIVLLFKKKTIWRASNLFCIFRYMPITNLSPLTPVMTAEDPWDTNNREKSRRKKDLMMKSCLCAPVPSWLKRKDTEAVRPRCMCMRDRLQRQVASKLLCWALVEVYKPSPPFKILHDSLTPRSPHRGYKKKKMKRPR